MADLDVVLHDAVARLAEDERFAALGRREREVAILIAGGFSNDEIAAAMTISPHTATSHSKNVLHKLGARNRAQAAAMVGAAIACAGDVSEWSIAVASLSPPESEGLVTPQTQEALGQRRVVRSVPRLVEPVSRPDRRLTADERQLLKALVSERVSETQPHDDAHHLAKWNG
jgi:DNA-binding CsgD family transcriptional regulator